jgi:hypothetical protein
MGGIALLDAARLGALPLRQEATGNLQPITQARHPAADAIPISGKAPLPGEWVSG